MSQPVDVITAGVFRAANEITERFVSATDEARKALTELSSTAGQPASGDQVSGTMARSLLEAAEQLKQPTAFALQALSDAAQSLTGIGQSYDTADNSGGASSLQAAAQALAPLTQVATTLPQMITEAVSATGEDLTADQGDQGDQDDQDDGVEVPPQGATVV